MVLGSLALLCSYCLNSHYLDGGVSPRSLSPAPADFYLFSYSDCGERLIVLRVSLSGFFQTPLKSSFYLCGFLLHLEGQQGEPRVALVWGRRVVAEWKWRRYEKEYGLRRGFVPSKDKVRV